MNDRQKNVAQYCDGIRTSRQIADLCGDNLKYVQEVALKFDLPRRKRGSSFGTMNGSYAGGRRIDRDGYVLVSAPLDHPYARKRKNRNTGIILEHRLVMEKKIGRYLDPSEVVDHIDGLHLHNDPKNLRLFDRNSEHLNQTISGQVPRWSKAGRYKLQLPFDLRQNLAPVDTYRRMKKAGDVRLREVLRAWLELDKDSPYLSGTNRWLKKAGIFDLSRSNLERELMAVYRRYA